MFKRKIYDRLLQWKEESQGRTALMIEGARRVGKSTVAETFGKNEYDSYILIDFSIASQTVKDLFYDLSDLNFFFLQFQLLYRTDLIERRSLIIFDEVQLFPMARQAIKALVKDGRYDYIETGSRISIRKNVKDILIPSEERKISMYPMDYEEFLWAIGDETTTKLLRNAFSNRKAVGEQMNRKLMRDFRLYMLIGGMPQAVDEYLRTNNFRLVDQVKRDILNLYEDDFRKIDPTGRISMLFDAIPAELNKNASRYQVSSVLGNERADSILELIAELKDSKTVNVAYHADDPNTGMSNHKNLGKFKLFLADTGLFTTLVFKDKDFTENSIYEKLLSDKLSVNLGYLYENIVAQMLTAKGNELFYYTFMNEKTRHNYEIDFILTRNNKICPIEVKSSGYKTHASLDKFSEKYSGRIAEKYLVYTKDLQKDKDVLMLPVYMVPFL
ncbi:ATP-binding protein [Mediterraneibacter glycyrrhizinilyticus]|uniref:ATP-binding protein n=1 Tax=Mediterraneibacter glycyrrhizinilyticus TaxID=342942 RepID=UPI0025A315C9|nr:AAA family ATPase [Mediterraneibacter glycyrrhizinilyticus]MDM8209694.1 AAA family ATPase [Mediterraneibacter glycyrrhizinilyticus]